MIKDTCISALVLIWVHLHWFWGIKKLFEPKADDGWCFLKPCIQVISRELTGVNEFKPPGYRCRYTRWARYLTWLAKRNCLAVTQNTSASSNPHQSLSSNNASPLIGIILSNGNLDRVLYRQEEVSSGGGSVSQDWHRLVTPTCYKCDLITSAYPGRNSPVAHIGTHWRTRRLQCNKELVAKLAAGVQRSLWSPSSAR